MYLVSLAFSELYSGWPSFTWFSRVLLSFYWALPSIAGLTEFHWVVVSVRRDSIEPSTGFFSSFQWQTEERRAKKRKPPVCCLIKRVWLDDDCVTEPITKKGPRRAPLFCNDVSVASADRLFRCASNGNGNSSGQRRVRLVN